MYECVSECADECLSYECKPIYIIYHENRIKSLKERERESFENFFFNDTSGFLSPFNQYELTLRTRLACKKIGTISKNFHECSLKPFFIPGTQK